MNKLTLRMQLVMDFVETTNTIVFLTGKAGTGKTTLLQRIRQQTRKKLAVVAPTGVAAINAGGMTIHSFFQFPFGPMIPGESSQPEFRYNQEKKELLAGLELLIMDEISMVRPDVLDQVDLVLRNIKLNDEPFGGVQLLLIGDLSQLSPIIRDEEWMLLGKYYATPYFFSSVALQKTSYVSVELSEVFRQKEEAFVAVLNGVRDQSLSSHQLALLNERYRPGFVPDAEEPYITLTTHNNIVRQLNSDYLDALAGAEQIFKATIRGEFPKDAYPTDTDLKLKVGAQVMFVKNDSSAEKKYYNGKLGIVARLATEAVYVDCNGEEIAVQVLEWNNVKYAMQAEEITETNAGSFAQIPLKLAWAITIHKSQGLSFERAIVDVSEAFAPGQAYVALSRCRTMSGLVLRNPVSMDNILADRVVLAYKEQAKLKEPNQYSLSQAQEAYHCFLLTELFDLRTLTPKLDEFTGLLPGAEEDLLAVSKKFIRQLKQERVPVAAAYFKQKLTAAIESLHLQLPTVVGTSKEKAARADQLIHWLVRRNEFMEHFTEQPFCATEYLALKSNSKNSSQKSFLKQLNAKPNEALFEDLMSWREVQANVEKVMPSMIFSEKTLASIAEKLPATLKALSGIKGIGPGKAEQYGAVLIRQIREYQQKQHGATAQNSLF